MTFTPLDEADLALIEINAPTPLVERLVHEVRRLRDENVAAWLAADELYVELREYRQGDR